MEMRNKQELRLTGKELRAIGVIVASIATGNSVKGKLKELIGVEDDDEMKELTDLGSTMLAMAMATLLNDDDDDEKQRGEA